MPTVSADIAIVGAGIAGPALGAALRSGGYDVVLIETGETGLDTARGDHLQPVACELLDKWNGLDAFLQHGAEKRLGSRWHTAAGELLLDARIDDLPLPHPYYLYLNHERISEVFLKLASENEVFTFLRPAKAALVDTDDGYALDVAMKGGKQLRVEASLIVAADGRSSQLRSAAGIATETFSYDTPFAILFAARTFADPRNDLRAYVGDRGIVSVVPRTGNGWKIGVPIARSEFAAWKKSTTKERAALLAEYVPALGALDTELAGFYPSMMLKVGSWTTRNLVLLGDACHAMHPARSQGMNTALKCIDALLRVLPEPDAIADRARLARALAQYERSIRPAIEEVLKENHLRGLEMDKVDPAESRALIERMKSIQADPEKRLAYRLQTTGYDAAKLKTMELVT